MRTSSRPRLLHIGSISHGTLRPEDLIPSFLWEAEHLRLTRAERHIVARIRRESDKWAEDGDSDVIHTDDQDEALEHLCDILNAHCPDYCHFGAHEGDGSDFGVWPTSVEDMQAEGFVFVGERRDVPKVKPTSSLYYTHCAEVNDHGNVTLYRRSGRTWREVWSVV